MPFVQFVGRVLPTSVEISIEGVTYTAKLNYGAPWNNSVSYTIGIKKSIVTVLCETDRYEREVHFEQLYQNAFRWASMVVDTVAFAHCVGISLEMHEFIDHDGKAKSIFPATPTIKPKSNAIVLSDHADFFSILRKLSQNPFAIRAMRDLIGSLTSFQFASISCARAIETIRRSMSPNAKVPEQWRIFRENLHLERSYIDPIIDQSANPRHGDPFIYSPQEIDLTLVKTFEIMNRYLEFLKRGQRPLPIEDFPILS